jgi:uncharacterized alpha-E superfamily protein
MLSRVADSLYWMARYLERAEHTARLVEVQLNLMLDQQPGIAERRWARILLSLGLEAPASFAIEGGTVARMLILDATKRSSVVSCIMQARENARQVREQISSPMWVHLNRLFHEIRRAAHAETDSDLMDFVAAVRDAGFLLQGVTDSTMVHDEGWQFIQIGRYLERAQMVAKLLDVHYREFDPRVESAADAREHLEWVGLLRSCTAFEAYCKTYTADLRPDRIAEFLLLNAEFPHTVRFSIDTVQRALNALPEAAQSRKASRLVRLAGRLSASLSYAQIDEVMGQGIQSYLEGIQRQCGQIHSSAYQGYIDYPIEMALSA